MMIKSDASPDDVIEATLRREVWEELGIGIEAIQLLRIDAVPYVVEEPGPYRLDFYFRCTPDAGFPKLRAVLSSGEFKPRSPEIRAVRLVPLSEVCNYDLFSPNVRLFRQKLLPLLNADTRE